MRRIVALASLLLFLSAAPALARQAQDGEQEPALLVTNKDVMTMVRAKIAPVVIIQKINTSICRFDTFPGVLAELKMKGVPDEVLSAMVAYRRPETAAPEREEVRERARREVRQPAREERPASGGFNAWDYGSKGRPDVATAKPGPSAGRVALETTESEGRKPTAADTRVVPGSTVFIDEMGGFEHYLASALRKKTVPLVVVLDPMQADYIIFGESMSKGGGWAKKLLLGDFRGTEAATITMVDRRTKVVVFADSSHRASANRGQRSTAEKLAKYLDRKITQDQNRAKKEAGR